MSQIIREYGHLRYPVVSKVDTDSIEKNSRLGLGMEKLDRDRFDPTRVYGWVQKSGVKWVRIQSGWAKTETVKGEYDFEWLDKIVDNLLSIGCTPWLCLCYGNHLYQEETENQDGGAFGLPPIHTEEQREAWRNYVSAVATHYKGKIKYYEVWNEPDGPWCWQHGVDGYEYGAFARDTGKAVKEADFDAKIISGSFCLGYTMWLDRAFRAGMADYTDYISYHSYNYDIDVGVERLVTDIRNVIDRYDPSIKIIQGEVGCQSRSDGLGAVADGQWNEKIQAKALLRRMITDISTEVEFSCWFSTVDMLENAIDYDPENPEKNYGFFGVLREELNEGMPTGIYSPKPSYYALQNLSKLFPDDAKVTPITIQCDPDLQISLQEKHLAPGDEVKTIGFKRDNGASAYVFWKSTDARRMDYHGTIRVYISGIKGDLKLIDTLTGEIMEIPEKYYKDKILRMIDRVHIGVSKEDTVNYGDRVIDLPLTDYPLILTIGDYID